MDGLLLPMILLAAGDKPNQKALLSQILPAVLPGPRTQRLAFAALSAKEQIRKQAQTERGMLQDAVKIGGFQKATDLDKFPALAAAYGRLSVADQAAVFAAASENATGKRGGTDT